MTSRGVGSRRDCVDWFRTPRPGRADQRLCPQYQVCERWHPTTFRPAGHERPPRTQPSPWRSKSRTQHGGLPRDRRPSSPFSRTRGSRFTNRQLATWGVYETCALLHCCVQIGRSGAVRANTLAERKHPPRSTADLGASNRRLAVGTKLSIGKGNRRPSGHRQFHWDTLTVPEK